MNTRLIHRPSEVIADGRRWSFGKPEFSTYITIVGIVIPSEMDVIELGPRPAVVFTEQVVSWVRHWYGDQYRICHPSERPMP